MNEKVEFSSWAPDWGRVLSEDEKKKPDFIDQYDPVDGDLDDPNDPETINDEEA